MNTNSNNDAEKEKLEREKFEAKLDELQAQARQASAKTKLWIREQMDNIKAALD